MVTATILLYPFLVEGKRKVARSMSKVWRAARGPFRQMAIGMLWWLALIVAVAVLVGPRRVGRLVGAGYLLSVQYPSETGFLETYHAVVLREGNSWVEFEHEAKRITVDDAAVRLERAMTAAGYAKYDERYTSSPSIRHGALFTSKSGDFCFDVVVTQVREYGTSIALVKSTYKQFSERAYEAEESLRGAFATTGSKPLSGSALSQPKRKNKK